MDDPKHPELPVLGKLPSGLISIHVAILLFGMAGLFGKFLALNAILIVHGAHPYCLCYSNCFHEIDGHAHTT